MCSSDLSILKKSMATLSLSEDDINLYVTKIEKLVESVEVNFAESTEFKEKTGPKSFNLRFPLKAIKVWRDSQ